MADKHLSIALAKEACPLCGKLVDGPILIDRKLRTTPNHELENLHKKCIGYKSEPCDECKENMKKGFLLIGIVESKSGPKVPDDVYRSGNIWVISDEVAKRLFDENILNNKAAYIDVNIAKKLGLPNVNLNV